MIPLVFLRKVTKTVFTTFPPLSPGTAYRTDLVTRRTSVRQEAEVLPRPPTQLTLVVA